MKALKAMFARWKKKHWDLKVVSINEPSFSFLGFDRPPLRAFWEKHKGLFFKAGPWLGGLVGGAIILKFIGLS